MPPVHVTSGSGAPSPRRYAALFNVGLTLLLASFVWAVVSIIRTQVLVNNLPQCSTVQTGRCQVWKPATLLSRHIDLVHSSRYHLRYAIVVRYDSGATQNLVVDSDPAGLVPIGGELSLEFVNGLYVQMEYNGQKSGSLYFFGESNEPIYFGLLLAMGAVLLAWSNYGPQRFKVLKPGIENLHILFWMVVVGGANVLTFYVFSPGAVILAGAVLLPLVIMRLTDLRT